MKYKILKTKDNEKNNQTVVEVNPELSILLSYNKEIKEWMAFPVVNGNVNYGYEIAQVRENIPFIDFLEIVNNNITEEPIFQ